MYLSGDEQTQSPDELKDLADWNGTHTHAQRERERDPFGGKQKINETKRDKVGLL